MEIEGDISGDFTIDIEPRQPKFSRPIFRVPPRLRVLMPSAYEPIRVSFGPYHHGKEKLKAMEDAKDQYKVSLLERNREKSWEDYLEGVRTIRDEAKGCYSGPLKISDEDFVNMMTLDACVIVEVLNKLNSPNELAEIDWHEVDPILREMMLLENQIPFIVLEKIWEVLKTDGGLVDRFLWVMRDTFSPQPGAGFPIEETPLHILHLLGHVTFPSPASTLATSQEPSPAPTLARGQESILSLSNLLRMGVKLEKNIQANGLKVSFFDGVMTMNPLKITGDTDKYLGNLTAFEQCYEGAKLNASSYAVLMNSLIKTPADVAALSSDNTGILSRADPHGQEVNVPDLFKTLRRGILKFKVDQGCNSRIILDWMQRPEICWEDSPKIFTVPAHIRDLKRDAYEPTVISFGPYHHGKESLKAMERQKWRYSGNLLRRYAEKTWEGCLEAVREIEDQARRYYKEPLGLGDDGDFVEVMTLDGCFQIELITKEKKDRTIIDSGVENGVQRGMILIENQIPFIVLQKISKYLDPDLPLLENLLDFVRKNYSPEQSDVDVGRDSRGGSLQKIFKYLDPLLLLHRKFLDSVRKIYSAEQSGVDVGRDSRGGSQAAVATSSSTVDSIDPLHLVDLLGRQMFCPGARADGESGGTPNESNSHTNVTPPLPQGASPQASGGESCGTPNESNSHTNVTPPLPQVASPQASGGESCGTPNELSSLLCSIPRHAQLKRKGVKFVNRRARGLV